MNETDFPYGQISDEFAKEFIDPWFKRCIEDFPHSGAYFGDAFYLDAIVRWMKKWFSQFKEDGV